MFIKMDNFADSDTTFILDADSLLLLEQAVTLDSTLQQLLLWCFVCF